MSKKTIGKIPYSLGSHTCNPSDRNSAKKVYPIAQRGETVGIEALARHIREHGSPYSAGVISGIITDAVECIKEQILLGNFVNLDGLGRFFFTLSAKGCDDATKFTDSMITKVNVLCDVDHDFEQEVNQRAQFQYVASREAQAEARKQEKAALNSGLGVSDDRNGDGDGDGGGNGGNGDGDDDTPGGIVTE